MKTAPLNPANLTQTNLVLIIVGLIILATGLFRTFPLRLKPALTMNGALLFFLAVGIIFFFLRRDASSYKMWAFSTVGFAANFLTLMFFLTLLMGLCTVLVKMYFLEMSDFLLKHPFWTPLVSCFVSATPNSLAPVITTMWPNPSLHGMFLFYLQGASLMSFPLFMMRKLGFNSSEICWKMYITGCLMSLICLPLVPFTNRATTFIYLTSGSIYRGICQWLF